MKRIGGLVISLAAACGCVTTGDMPSGGGWGAPPRPAQAKADKQIPGAVGPHGEAVSSQSVRADNGIVTASAKSSVAASTKSGGAADPNCGCEKPIFGYMAPEGSVYARGGMMGGPPMPMPAQRSQVRFVGPAGAKIGWYVPAPAPDKDGKPILTPYKMDIPGRYNFLQASIYRLKLTDVPGRPGVQLYPTIEVVPANPKTDAFLAHNAIPVEFTEEDFDQVSAGNFITKVIYLPDSQHMSPVAGGPEELVSTRLEPGVDPIAEAHRRGYILLVVRLGGIELESINSPPLENSGMYGTPKAPTTTVMPAPLNMTPTSDMVPPLPQGAATATDGYRQGR